MRIVKIVAATLTIIVALLVVGGAGHRIGTGETMKSVCDSLSGVAGVMVLPDPDPEVFEARIEKLRKLAKACQK